MASSRGRASSGDTGRRAARHLRAGKGRRTCQAEQEWLAIKPVQALSLILFLGSAAAAPFLPEPRVPPRASPIKMVPKPWDGIRPLPVVGLDSRVLAWRPFLAGGPWR